MKKSLFTWLASCALAVCLVGCGSETTVDSTKLKAEFSGASAEIKTEADAAAAAIDSGDMRAAVASLGKVLSFSNDLSQAQINAAEEAFVLANVVLVEKGDAQSKAESKANKSELQNQAQGAE